MKTTSYEISKQLAKAGFEGKTDFTWNREIINCGNSSKEHKFIKYNNGWSSGEVICPAYDLETILETLPNFIVNKNQGENCLVIDVAFGVIHYEGDNENDTLFITTTRNNESLADTAARLLILLHKEGIVNFNKKIK